MKLFRRGGQYLVYYSLERGWLYDAATRARTAEARPVDLMGGEPCEWLPVYEHDDLPEGLRRHLILPMGRRDDTRRA